MRVGTYRQKSDPVPGVALCSLPEQVILDLVQFVPEQHEGHFPPGSVDGVLEPLTGIEEGPL